MKHEPLEVIVDKIMECQWPHSAHQRSLCDKLIAAVRAERPSPLVHLDMLMADRLRWWASDLNLSRDSAGRMREIADAIEAVIKEAPRTLQAQDAPQKPEAAPAFPMTGDREATCAWDCQMPFPHDGPCMPIAPLAPVEGASKTPEWGVVNCLVLARRRINALRQRVPLDALLQTELESWEHIQRICELAGAKTQGVLRASLPTEIIDGGSPAPVEGARPDVDEEARHWQEAHAKANTPTPDATYLLVRDLRMAKAEAEQIASNALDEIRRLVAEVSRLKAKEGRQ